MLLVLFICVRARRGARATTPTCALRPRHAALRRGFASGGDGAVDGAQVHRTELARRVRLDLERQAVLERRERLALGGVEPRDDTKEATAVGEETLGAERLPGSAQARERAKQGNRHAPMLPLCARCAHPQVPPLLLGKTT